MKNLKSLIGLILVLLVSLSVTSCNDDNDESLDQQWATVLNNHGIPYVFSDNGNCYGAGGGTFFNWAREENAPFSRRYSTIFFANVGPRPLT